MRPIGLLLCLTMSARAIAPAPTPSEAPFSTKGAFFGLSVADVEASVRWYSEILGMTVVFRPPKIEGSTAVVLEGGGLIVELYSAMTPCHSFSSSARGNGLAVVRSFQFSDVEL